MKLICVFFLMIFLVFNCLGQFSDTDHAVSLGDKVPDYEFKNVLNYKAKTLKISDFHGRLLILDFWGRGCASCIASWPHLLELQKTFGDRVQIVLVSPLQDRETTKNVFDRRKKIAGVEMNLPSVSGDSSILKLFPVSGVPHIVWINGDGILESVTYGSSLNYRNISDMLEGKKVIMTQKINNDEQISARFERPLFLAGNGGDPKAISFYSILGRSNDRLFQTYGVVSNDVRKEHYVIATNYCLRDLYRLAYSNRITKLGVEMILKNRMILNVEDSSKYVDLIYGEIQRDNLFTYQLIMPGASVEDLKDRMKSDLTINVGLKANWKRMTVKCLVLESSDTSCVSYKSGGYRANISNSEIDLNGIYMAEFVELLESWTDYGLSRYPIVDETGIKGKLGRMLIEADVVNHKVLDKELRKYRMKLSLEERKIDMLEVSESSIVDNIFQN